MSRSKIKILTLGPGTELAKIEINSDYPIIPADLHLLGMQFNSQLHNMLMAAYHMG